MGNNSDFLDPLLSPTLQDDGTSLTRRAKVNYIGFSVADNPTDGSTDITNTGGGGSVVFADLAAWRAATHADNEVSTVVSPVGTWVYDADTGAGLVDDGLTILKPTAISVGSNGRGYNVNTSQVLPTIASLRLAVSGQQSSISVQNYATPGDGAGGIFDYDSSDTTTADNTALCVVAGTRRYKRRVPNGLVDVKWMGAKGDGAKLTGLTTSAGVKTITKAGFTAADIGKLFVVDQAGTGAAGHATTIENVAGTTVTLTVAPVLSVSGKGGTVGTDDSIPIQATIDLVKTQGSGTISFSRGLYTYATQLKTGDDVSASIGLIFRSYRRSNNPANATLCWCGAIGATMFMVRQSHLGAFDSVGFDANNLADYGLWFIHRFGDPYVVEHWDVDGGFFTNARKANVLIGEPDGTAMVSNAGDESTIKFKNCYFLKSFIGAPTVYHVRQRSVNALGNNIDTCQFDGDGTNPHYFLSCQGGGLTASGGPIAVGSGIGDLHQDADGTNVPGYFWITSWESQSRKFLVVDTAASGAASQRNSSFTKCYQAYIGIGPAPDNCVDINAVGYGAFDFRSCRFLLPFNITSLGTGSTVNVDGVNFAGGTGAFTGATTKVIGNWTDETGARREQFAAPNLVGPLAFDATQPVAVSQTKRTGTGANAGSTAVYSGQDGQQQTGGAANNNGGDTRVDTGDPGTGGGGAAGVPGHLLLAVGKSSPIDIFDGFYGLGGTGPSSSTNYCQWKVPAARSQGGQINAGTAGQLFEILTDAGFYISSDVTYFRGKNRGAAYGQMTISTNLFNLQNPLGKAEIEGSTGVRLRVNGVTVIEIDGTGIGLNGHATMAQPSRVGALADSTSGTPSTTLGTTGVPAIDNNFASVLLKVNALEAVFHNRGDTT